MAFGLSYNDMDVTLADGSKDHVDSIAEMERERPGAL